MTLRPRRLILWSCVVWVGTMALLVFFGSIWASYERLEITERRSVPQPTLPHPTPLAAPVKHGKFHREIAVASHLCGVESALLRALVARESNFDPWAMSPSGAAGLTQLMPSVASEMGVRDARFDPQANLTAGACHLRRMLDRFKDPHRALVAYHRGASGGTSAKSRAYADDVIQGSAQ